MRLFLDTEFTGLHQNTSLISFALVSEEGHEFYAEILDYDKSQLDAWLLKNVVNELYLTPGFNYDGKRTFVKALRSDVTRELLAWLNNFDEIEVWSDCLAYDWVLFNELFGGGRQKPNNVYYIPFDICTLFKLKGIDPDISRVEFTDSDPSGHNALDDARLIRACYVKLMNTEE